MAATKLHDLIALAQEPSSDRRRELLREVTDLFFVGADGRQPAELALFDDVLSQLAGEMEEAVRAELAERMADVAQPPPKLIGRFTSDTVAVAEPVLTRSPALTDDDLLRVARTRDQDHLRAISRRFRVPEAVSDAIVQRGDQFDRLRQLFQIGFHLAFEGFVEHGDSSGR